MNDEERGTPVNHPTHYNVVKYVARAEHKGKQLEDLKKGKWYLDRLIATLEAKDNA